MGRHGADVESEVRLHERRNRLFRDAAIGGVIRKAGACLCNSRLRTAADPVKVLKPIGQRFEVEGVKRRNDACVGPAYTVELVRNGYQVEQIVRNVRCRTDAAPGVVLNETVGRTNLVFDKREARVDAFQDIATVVVVAGQLDLIDFVAEIGVTERVARGRDQRCIQGIDAGIHDVGQRRQIVLEINRLRLDAKDCVTDRRTAAVLVGGLRFSSRMVRVEHHGDATGRIPLQVAA